MAADPGSSTGFVDVANDYDTFGESYSAETTMTDAFLFFVLEAHG